MYLFLNWTNGHPHLLWLPELNKSSIITLIWIIMNYLHINENHWSFVLSLTYSPIYNQRICYFFCTVAVLSQRQSPCGRKIDFILLRCLKLIPPQNPTSELEMVILNTSINNLVMITKLSLDSNFLALLFSLTTCTCIPYAHQDWLKGQMHQRKIPDCSIYRTLKKDLLQVQMI